MSSFAQAPRPVDTTWSAEVDGVPTGAVARRDDDDALVMEVNERHTKLAGAGFDRRDTTTVTDGAKKATTEIATKGGYKDKAGSLSRTTTTETAYSERVSKKDTATKGVGGGAGHGHVTWGSEHESRVGDRKQAAGSETKLGWKSGHIDAEHKHSSRTEDAHGATAQSTSLGLEDGKLKVGSSHERETKRVVDGTEKTSKRGTETSLKVGKDGAGVEHAFGTTNERGTSRKTTVGAELDKHGNASLSAGHAITDKSGRSFKVSVNAGVTVVASEPAKVGDSFVVTWKRTKTVGGAAGASAKVGPINAGVNASGSASDIDSGTRSFKTEKEANDFREHAAERIRETADPRSLKGALSMEIGESRGHGHAIEGALNGSIGSGGVSLGAGASKKASDGLQVRRVSANLFEVTRSDGSESDRNLAAGAPGVAGKEGHKAEQHQEVVLRFDLGTADGQAAFERYCQTGEVPPKGAEMVRRAKGQLSETYGGVSVKGGFESRSYGKTWENDVVDAAGHHEEYGGERGSSQKAGWIGRHITHDKDMHRSVQILSRQENDRAAGIGIRATFGGQSGENIRGGMQNLFGERAQGESWDGKDIENHASGEWSMTADLDVKTLHKLANVPFFGGDDLDAQMRAVAELVADRGAGGAKMLGALQDGGLKWDVELKGDRNFPGRAGREELEAKITAFSALLDAGDNAAGTALVGPLDAEVRALRARRDAVGDPKRYLDLPDAVRAEQLMTIDQQLGKLEMLRHRAALEAMKLDGGEDANAIAARHASKDGYAKMAPEQRALAQLRDEIALEDAAIVGYEKQTEEAAAALLEAVGHYTDWSRENSAALGRTVSRETGQGGLLHKKQTAEFLGLDELRIAFFQNMGQPETAIPLGRQLLSKLRAQQAMAAEAQARYHEAARAEALLLKGGGAAKHAAFWADVRDGMDEDELAGMN